jgi:hypothetical protein
VSECGKRRMPLLATDSGEYRQAARPAAAVSEFRVPTQRLDHAQALGDLALNMRDAVKDDPVACSPVSEQCLLSRRQ